MTDTSLPYSALTLNEALAAFREDHGLAEKYLTMRPEAQAQFERHDIVHVLFGLDTSMSQEAQADGWTIFGTDISRHDISAFFDLPEEKELIKDLGFWSVAKGYLAAIPHFIRIAWRSRRLARKWCWSDNARYRGMTVSAIRREFGIDRALTV